MASTVTSTPSARRRSATVRSSSRPRSLDTDTTLFHQRHRSQATATTHTAPAPPSAPTATGLPRASATTPPTTAGGARSADHPTTFSSISRNGPPRTSRKIEKADERRRRAGPGPYSNQPPLLRTPPIVPRRVGGRRPRIVHTVPVIICEFRPILLPMNDWIGAPRESATRMTGAATCRGSQHSGVRTETCAPTQHPGPPRGRRSSDSVPGPRSIRSSSLRSGWSLLAPTLPTEYWRSSSRARYRGRRPHPAGVDADASDSLECVRWYRSSGAAQRDDEYLSNELADNTTSKFLK